MRGGRLWLFAGRNFFKYILMANQHDYYVLNMALSLHHTSNFTKMVIIAEFFIVSYLLYTLTVSVYKSYQIDQYINNFQQENNRIAQENREKEEEYAYVTSDAYIEKMGKQILGLAYQGEKVIVIPKSEFTANGDAADSLDENNFQRKSANNFHQWWKFFFDISDQKQ